MTTPAPASSLTVDLTQRFPGVVQADARPGYSGFIVEKDSLIEVATAVRDEFGFDLMSDEPPKTKPPSGEGVMEYKYSV